MTKPPYFILADDFTGAHDVGLPFHKQGFRTVCIGHSDHLASVDADVVVIDTDSRDCTADEARRRVTDACKAVLQQGGRLLYKKIDSTLRGHIGEELDAVHHTFGHAVTILAPAFPELGRTTIGGYHLINGIPVDRTAMGDDPGSPVSSAFIPDMLKNQGIAVVEHVDLRAVMMGPEEIGRQVMAALRPPYAVVVMDAASPDALAAILPAVAELQPKPLLCGSAGLARPLAAWLASQEEIPNRGPAPLNTGSDPVLIIAGSVHPATIQQIDEASRRPHVAILRIDAAALLSPQEAPQEMNRVVHTAEGGLSSGQDMLLALAPGEDTDRHAWIRRMHERADGRNLVTALAGALGQMTRRIMTAHPAGIVLTGGETAAWTVRHLEASGTVIEQEILDGIALATLLDGPYRGLPVVVKPGAFGGRDGLIESIAALHRLRPAATTPGDRPVLGITIGDPNGVGPEIIVKVLSKPEIYDLCRPLVIGHGEVIARHRKFTPLPLTIHPVHAPQEGIYRHGVVDVLDVMELDADALIPGQVQEVAGRLAVEAVIAATKLAMHRATQAVVTAPLNKEAMNLAGYHYAGHTELLAELTGTKQYRLTLAFDDMLVSHVTTHVSLRQAIERLSEAGVISTIEIIGQALQRMGIPKPRIAVAGLNPHAGEGGMFGDEEIRIITPAVERARDAGWDIIGPLPPDTVFLRARRGEFDGIVGMYHDQGHIPVKAIAFDRTVNVSLGLPIIRTSVDHGTAFDIAGRGVANAENLEAAIRMAVRLVGDRWSVTSAG